MSKQSKSVEPFRPDGFVICDRESGDPAYFVASEHNGRMREKVEDGVAMRVDFGRFYFFDTREVTS